MLRVIWVYARGRAFSFLPAEPGDRPVFGALVHQVGVQIRADQVVIPRAGVEPLTPTALMLAARHRMFRLRVYQVAPRRPARRRGRRPGRSHATDCLAG